MKNTSGYFLDVISKLFNNVIKCLLEFSVHVSYKSGVKNIFLNHISFASVRATTQVVP